MQAQGQPFEALQLPSSEHASGAVPALAVADADGWRFCFVEAAGEGEAAAMEP